MNRGKKKIEKGRTVGVIGMLYLGDAGLELIFSLELC